MMNRFQRVLAIAVVLTAVLAAVTLHARVDGGRLSVTVFDVGQGDGILIQTPYGQNILIDGGPNESIVRKLGERLPFYDRQIDLALLTHAHADHVTGQVAVLDSFDVKRVLGNGEAHTSGIYLKWLERIRDGAMPFEAVDGPRTIILGENLELQILYPLRSVVGERVENPNNASVVARLVYGNTAFLFTGDAEAPVEGELLAAGSSLRADVLKVGHHGSSSSSTPAFIDEVHPSFAVISSGARNSYGHPHPQTLELLQRLGVRVYRTDMDGDITFTSDGNKITPHLK